MRHVMPQRCAISKKACCCLRAPCLMNGSIRVTQRREHGYIHRVGDTVIVRHQSRHRVWRRVVRVSNFRASVAEFFREFRISVDAQAAREANVGLRFWVYVTTVPLTLLTLASLVAAWVAPNEVRNWWLAAGAAVLVDRVMTFTYFIPTMLTLMNSKTMSASEAVTKAVQWIKLGYIRHAATLIAWLAALRAFSLFSKLG